MNPAALFVIVLIICMLAVYFMPTYGPKYSIVLFFVAATLGYLGLNSNLDHSKPDPETKIQLVILESDRPNADGSHTYSISINPVGYLTPYKMAHEVGRMLITYKNVDLVLEAIKMVIAGQNPTNQIFTLNSFES